MNEKLVIRELRARWHQKSARRKSHGVRLKNQAWRISRSRRLIASFTRPSASGDRPSPSSKHSPEIKMYEIKEAKNGKFHFNLKASNGQVIGTSQLYASEASCKNGIESVMKNAPTATIVDETEQ
jgi:uncharacterized protein YegP (UPF0339 family)